MVLPHYSCEKMSGCYNGDGDYYDVASISDCTCHDSCGACGYGSDPTGSTDCISCSDPTYEVNPVNEDGTGECVKIPKSGCYETEGDEASIADCTCHESCGACGYGSDPTGSTDCISACSNPTYEVNPVNEDGTGECVKIPKSGCYETEGDEASIADCVCHETCGACGYAESPTGIRDCLTCSDPTD
jgi:hypothetical protein